MIVSTAMETRSDGKQVVYGELKTELAIVMAAAV